MGIDPIRYKPWSGERTGNFERIFMISKTFFLHKLRSKWLMVLMILGLFLTTTISIFVYVMIPHGALEPEVMTGLIGAELFQIITILLVAMICSDTISEDLRSNSFVLYFSRAIKAESYLAGKMGGALLTLSLFTFFPPVIMALIVMATQTGSDYGSSLGVFGLTILACLVATLYFLPFGVLISSLTNRKSYAAVATFMAIFILTIIGEIFTEFDPNWILINPTGLLSIFFDWLYGFGIPSNISVGLFSALFFGFFFIPFGLLYLRIRMKAVGR